MSVASNKTLYYILRVCSALLGVFFVSLSLLSLLYAATGSQRSSWPNSSQAALMLYGLLLIVPHRWLNQPLVFPFTLIVFALGILLTAYVGLSGVMGFVQGRNGWLILLESIILMLFALFAPAALVMHRRLDVDLRNEQ